MFLKSVSRYWLFQIIGWVTSILMSVFFVTTFGNPVPLYFVSLVLGVICGLLLSHLMRMFIHRMHVLSRPISKQVLYFFGLTLLFSIFYGIAAESIDFLLHYNPDRLHKYSRGERLFLSCFNALWIFGIWNLIYYLYHYVERNRKQEIDKLRLEALVKSFELKTIKSHINPHFIFNALNSIRALVDENPSRARTAITELSNILRSSLRAEQMETVPLQQELLIVKDYLALEQMRFEERLKIEMDINPDTLHQPVPPMMLQTLVENAIKHGISKQINGGFIRVKSLFVNNHHEIIVTNSGTLAASENNMGFGIKSTRDRLKLIYQDNAYFEIKNDTADSVESKLIMPVSEIL